MAAPKISMKHLISSAPQAQEIYQLKARIEELEVELSQVQSKSISIDPTLKDELEARIQELTNELAASSGEHEVELALIDPDSEQPRKSFPDKVVQERAESLKRYGQQTPIIVIPQPNGRYTLFEGELRTRGANLLNWKTIKAVFLSEENLSSQAETLERQLITSIHSIRVNDLDLAETIIRLLIHRHPHLDSETIPRLLQSALYQLNRADKLSDLEQVRIADEIGQQKWLSTLALKESDEESVLALLLWLQLNPNSVKAHVFPLLNLPDDLKQAIRQEGIESSKARELSKLSADTLDLEHDKALRVRSEATEKVIQSKLSLSQTKVLIRDLLHQYTSSISNNSVSKDVDNKAAKAVKQIEEISFESMEKKQLKVVREALQLRLKEIDTILHR